jgi:nitrate reductase (cytochrome), electron transfer subunit
MVPHDTEGMLPITISDNQCVMCHMPDAAKEMGMGATASSKVSHSYRF